MPTPAKQLAQRARIDEAILALDLLRCKGCGRVAGLLPETKDCLHCTSVHASIVGQPLTPLQRRRQRKRAAKNRAFYAQKRA